MLISIIIPLWNGASVILECLRAVFTHSTDVLFEVICVDNASSDGSAALVLEHYPQVRLVSESVNLGFAGGVNAGIDVACGDVFVLLNQDCIVLPGWSVALTQAFEQHPEFGIAGCVLLNADGSVNHAGALIHRPDAYGVHLTELRGESPWSVEYVTGTMFAIRRSTWEKVGRFDEGFYPAYYEESDYCYRARRQGFDVGLVPGARGTHLFSSREWRDDPVRYTANQHRARYRFVIKHFDSETFAAFVKSEIAALEVEPYFDQAIARVFAARDTLRGMADIVERRRIDDGETVLPAHRRQMQLGFTGILRRAFAAAEKLGPYQHTAALAEMRATWQPTTERVVARLRVHPVDDPTIEHNRPIGLQYWQQRAYAVLDRIHFTSHFDSAPEPTWKRWLRLLILRPLSFVVGRESFLLSELGAVNVARVDVHDQQLREMYALIEQIDRRLAVLELLTDYDYR